MSSLFRNGIALVAGFFSGGFVNMSLVKTGPLVFPPPPGVDMMTAEGIAAAIPLLRPEHFVFPFLAHAFGTFVGALVAQHLAATHRTVFAWIIGGFTLCTGVAAAVMIPAPAWFKAIDLLLAYLPMTWLAIRLGAKLRPGT